MSKRSRAAEAEQAAAATPSPPVVQVQPKRGLRKFSWFIIVVNVLFLVWVIAGVSSAGHGTNCGNLDQATCDAAQGIGATIGVGIIIAIWAFVDLILLVLWTITKPRQR